MIPAKSRIVASALLSVSIQQQKRQRSFARKFAQTQVARLHQNLQPPWPKVSAVANEAGAKPHAQQDKHIFLLTEMNITPNIVPLLIAS